MGKRKRMKAIKARGVRQSLPPYVLSMRCYKHPRTKSAAPECDQHPETAKGGEIETSSAAILPEPKGDCKK